MRFKTTDDTYHTDEQMIHEELSGEIVGAAMEVNVTGLDLALLINFKNARLEWKRVLRRQESKQTANLICMLNSCP
jgi:hypothetical protein